MKQTAKNKKGVTDYKRKRIQYNKKINLGPSYSALSRSSLKLRKYKYTQKPGDHTFR